MLFLWAKIEQWLLSSTDYKGIGHNSGATEKSLINIGGGEFITQKMKPKPMTKQQLESLKKEINKIYLFLIGHSEYDPKVVEIMKLSALVDVQKRFENREPW